MLTYTDSSSLFQRRKPRPREAEGHGQSDTVCVRTEAQTTLVTLVSTPFALWVLRVAQQMCAGLAHSLSRALDV